MSNNLEIHLLGGFAVTLNGQPVRSFRTAKTRALLAYLATEADRAHSRATLATLFWGDLPDTAAKTNLRIELSNLKQILDAHAAVDVDRNFVRFHSALATTDVQSFDEGVKGFLALPAEAQGAALPQLAALLDLYQGEFLAGFHAGDAIEFEDWQLITREQLHEQMMLALTTVQARYAEQGRWSQLADAARRQLAIVPWTESAHRSLMQAHAAQGNVQAALAQYEKCCEILQEELGVEPSLPTQEFAARLRGDTSGRPTVQHNLAQQLKSFVGREEEIAQLRPLVQKEKTVTLLGIGGVGKSHLAQAVARQVLPDFADGVWFVPLANIEAHSDTGADAEQAAPERIALAIAGAIGFHITDTQRPLAELVSYMAPKQMLLILDNCEHLREAAATVIYALIANDSIHILATSRIRLMIEGESALYIEGLPPAMAYTLFLDRARRVLADFAMADGKEEEKQEARQKAKPGDKQGDKQEATSFDADIMRICEQVGGLPLGIELAASWVEHYSVAEIGHSIAKLAIAPQQSHEVMSRHHQLTGVLNFSWQLLSAHQQQILAKLSLFRGGFDRAAASVVAAGTLSDLSALISHSLVQRVSAGRYNLHPLIQEFASGKVAVEEAPDLYAAYSTHYLSTLKATPRADRKEQLFIELENIRSGWQHAVSAGDAGLVQEAVIPFGEYMVQFGLLVDGNKLITDAVARFEEQAEKQTDLRELVAELLDQQSIFVRSLKGMAGMRPLIERVLTLTERNDLRARSHGELANYYGEVGDWEQADFHFDQAEAFAEAAGDMGMYISMAEERIHINAIHFRGDFAVGIARLEELLHLLDTTTTPIDDRESLRARLIQSLSLSSIRYGDYAVSIHYTRQAIAWADALAHQRRRCHLLLDLALAEQFAGMYDEAIAHNREALAVAEEMGDMDESGLLNANLCLTLRQAGELEAALAHGLKAIGILSTLGNQRILGQAHNRIGHTLSMLGRWADAYAMYGDALVVWEPMQHPNRYEAVAGRAAAALRLGKEAEALAGVEEVLRFEANNGLMGIVEPVRLLLNCETVLSGLGDQERGHQVLERAGAWVEMIANRISAAEVRDAFLHNRPDNQTLRSRIGAMV